MMIGLPTYPVILIGRPTLNSKIIIFWDKIKLKYDYIYLIKKLFNHTIIYYYLYSLFKITDRKRWVMFGPKTQKWSKVVELK